tara:strand:- start:97613 stop:97966 length:354 start_codon:yes stop_codon:yes gene_type:complete
MANIEDKVDSLNNRVENIAKLLVDVISMSNNADQRADENFKHLKSAIEELNTKVSALEKQSEQIDNKLENLDTNVESNFENVDGHLGKIQEELEKIQKVSQYSEQYENLLKVVSTSK